MAKRSSKGGYLGGSTTINARDKSWFSGPKKPKDKPELKSVSPPPLSTSEAIIYDAIRKKLETPKFTLIKAGALRAAPKSAVATAEQKPSPKAKKRKRKR